MSSKQGLTNSKTSQPVPLTSMSVQISLVDVLAEITFEQTYKNTSKNPIEAVYSLVLPLKTAISNFIITIENRKVKGVVREKEKAAAEYEDTIATGGSAFLVEKSDRKDVNEFKMSVGSLKEGVTAKVELTFLSYLDVLENDKSIQRFRLPVELLPASVTTFNLTCSVWTTSPPLKIHTPNGVFSENQTHTTHVLPTSDFVVEIQTSATVVPQAVLEIDPINTDSQAVMITHFPTFSGFNPDFFEPKAEIVFVVDRSGSMNGDRIAQTRIAMNMLIHAIPQDSIFNIIGFGTSQDWLFPKSVPYTASNLQSAEYKVQSLTADLGGTDLLAPLRGLFSHPVNPDYPRIVYVLTDGAVDDRGACIAEVKRHSDEIRLYALGIGSGVDHALVTGITEAGRGRGEFVVNSKDIEEKVMKLFAESLTPCINKLNVDWGGDVVVEQSPVKIMALRSGDRMIAYGLVEKGKVGEKIKVTGVDPEGNNVEWDVPVVERKGELVKKLTAFALIRDLQEKRSRFHVEGRATDDVVKAEIVRLGTKYQLASEHTSFIASVDADDDTEATGGTMVLQKVKLVAPPEPKQESKKESYSSGTKSAKKSKKSMPSPSLKSAAPASRSRQAVSSDKKEEKKSTSSSSLSLRKGAESEMKS